MTLGGSTLWLAGAGAILGSLVTVYIWAHRPSRRQVLAVNAISCGLLGVLLGAPSLLLSPFALLTLGFLCATSPLAWVFMPWAVVDDRSGAVRIALRIASMAAVHLAIGGAFALAGFVAASGLYLIGLN